MDPVRAAQLLAAQPPKPRLHSCLQGHSCSQEHLLAPVCGLPSSQTANSAQALAGCWRKECCRWHRLWQNYFSKIFRNLWCFPGSRWHNSGCAARQEHIIRGWGVGGGAGEGASLLLCFPGLPVGKRQGRRGDAGLHCSPTVAVTVATLPRHKGAERPEWGDGETGGHTLCAVLVMTLQY